MLRTFWFIFILIYLCLVWSNLIYLIFFSDKSFTVWKVILIYLLHFTPFYLHFLFFLSNFFNFSFFSIYQLIIHFDYLQLFTSFLIIFVILCYFADPDFIAVDIPKSMQIANYVRYKKSKIAETSPSQLPLPLPLIVEPEIV